MVKFKPQMHRLLLLPLLPFVPTTTFSSWRDDYNRLLEEERQYWQKMEACQQQYGSLLTEYASLSAHETITLPHTPIPDPIQEDCEPPQWLVGELSIDTVPYVPAITQKLVRVWRRPDELYVSLD